MITKKEFLELSNVQDAKCISIFIPTHRAGQPALQGQDALSLKNQLKELTQKLKEENLDERVIDTLLKPAEALIEDGEFWRHQSDGLAIFIAEGIFKKFVLPISFQANNHVSSNFYLLPLIPLFNDDGMFYLLTLKPDGVKLYEGSRYAITNIDISDIVPSQIEDLTGQDHEPGSVKFRVQQGHKGAGVHHGHGEISDDIENELKRFYREVDKGLMTLWHDNQKPPLVLACVDPHFSIYNEVSSYQNIFDQYIPGNPDEFDVLSLHGQAWDLLQTHFAEKRNEKRDLFLQVERSGTASSQIETIVPAAIDGRIDTLFIQADTDVYGKYDPKTRKLTLHDENGSSADVSLLNLMAVRILDQGGSVYFVEKEDMPNKTSKLNALFRY